VRGNSGAGGDCQFGTAARPTEASLAMTTLKSASAMPGGKHRRVYSADNGSQLPDAW